jgi:hypothetical protein
MGVIHKGGRTKDALASSCENTGQTLNNGGRKANIKSGKSGGRGMKNNRDCHEAERPEERSNAKSENPLNRE